MANIDNLFRVDNGLSLNDELGIFQGSLDPSSSGFEAPIGSIYIRNTGDTYSKFGSNDLNWKQFTLNQSGIKILTVSNQTTNNTPTELFIDGIGGNQRMVLPDDTTWTFNIFVAARRSDTDNQSASYLFLGSIDRNTGAASTALVGNVNRTIIAEDVGGWNCVVNADNTNGSLRIQATGATGATVNWLARVEIVEVTG